MKSFLKRFSIVLIMMMRLDQWDMDKTGLSILSNKKVKNQRTGKLKESEIKHPLGSAGYAAKCDETSLQK